MLPAVPADADAGLEASGFALAGFRPAAAEPLPDPDSGFEAPFFAAPPFVASPSRTAAEDSAVPSEGSDPSAAVSSLGASADPSEAAVSSPFCSRAVAA